MSPQVQFLALEWYLIVFILNQLHPVHKIDAYFCKIHVQIFLHLYLGFLCCLIPKKILWNIYSIPTVVLHGISIIIILPGRIKWTVCDICLISQFSSFLYLNIRRRMLIFIFGFYSQIPLVYLDLTWAVQCLRWNTH